MNSSRYLLGDSASVLSSLPGGSVQLVVTSPPYGGLKDYHHPAQIGHGEPYLQYLARMNQVWEECSRVLEPGCKLCINIGDQFLRASENDGVYEVLPIHADIIQQVTGLDGIIYLGSILWRKITNSSPSGGGSFMGSLYHPRDGYVSFEHEFILLFKKLGHARRPRDPTVLDKSKLTREQRSLWFRGIWDIPPACQQLGHPARFPVELPERLIRMYTFYGETVLDPFVGGGTTLDAAQKSGRYGIGVDINPDYQWAWESQTQNLFRT